MTKLSFVFVFVAFMGLVPAAHAQSVADLPICAASGYAAFPSGPMVGWVSDLNFSGAEEKFLVTTQDPFSIPVHRLRSIAPGEAFRLKGMGFSPYGSLTPNVTGSGPILNGLSVTAGGKIVTLYYAGLNQNNPAELAGANQINGEVPRDVVADASGNVEIAVLGKLDNGKPCRGVNSPFTVKLASVVDAVYGYPLDADHPLSSGFVRFWDTNASLLTVDNQVVNAVSIGGDTVADVTDMLGLAEVRGTDGSVVTSFSIPSKRGSRLVRH